MRLKGAITALVLGALSLTCVAGELIVHTVSRHTHYNRDVSTTKPEWNGYMWVDDTSTIRAYNNQNFGLGWRTDSGLVFGVYRNSYYRTSVYVAQEFMLNRYVGAFAGVGTGYYRTASLIGGLVLKVPVTDRTGLQLMGAPKIGNVDGVLHLAVSYRF